MATEVLEQILKHACTDGGHTGNALAAVSRYVRGVSAPVRYHSVALCGAHQIRAFIRLLDDIGQLTLPPPKLRTFKKSKRSGMHNNSCWTLSAPVVVIRHLFLADCARDRYAYNDTSDSIWTHWTDKVQAKKIVKSMMGYRNRIVDAIPYPLNPNPMRRYFRHEAITIESQRIAVFNAEAAITNLLRRVAPSLQHLCYDRALPSLGLNFPVSLPALEELTCRVDHGLTCRFYDNDVESYKPISFLLQLPMLKSLHVVLRGMQWCTCVPREVPPSLERVRFSDSTSPSLIVNELTNRRPWLTQDSLFIILVSHDYEDLSYSEYSWPSRPKLARMIESARQDMLRKIHAVKDLKKYNQHRLHTEWLARVQGREGCWKEGTPLTLMKKWHRIPSQS
jgi:hypothetical protein